MPPFKSRAQMTIRFEKANETQRLLEIVFVSFMFCRMHLFRQTNNFICTTSVVSKDKQSFDFFLCIVRWRYNVASTLHRASIKNRQSYHLPLRILLIFTLTKWLCFFFFFYSSCARFYGKTCPHFNTIFRILLLFLLFMCNVFVCFKVINLHANKPFH